MSQREQEFYRLLMAAASDRYYIFPQIHLSAIFKNETYGKYHKLAFQIINRKSVDYVLCDKQSFNIAYAVELDDTTHDSLARKRRDREVNELFALHGIPLIRFRDFSHLSAEDIAKRFYQAKQASLPISPSI